MSPRSIALLACTIALAACTEAQQPAVSTSDSLSYFGLSHYSEAPPMAGRAADAPARVVSNAEAKPATLRFHYDANAMIIRSAKASVEVDSLEPAVAAAREIAGRVGGYVANVAVQTGAGQLRRATLELKVPAERFDDAVNGLTPLGKVESVDVNAADVGEEFVDVTARMENARRLERRLIELLAARTGKLADVLEVEQSLARVREEIERYEGRIRYLRAHVATSTIAVYLHEPVPIVGTAGTSVMGHAFAQAWRNFVTLLALAVQSLGILLPLGVVAGIALLATRKFRGARVNASRLAEP